MHTPAYPVVYSPGVESEGDADGKEARLVSAGMAMRFMVDSMDSDDIMSDVVMQVCKRARVCVYAQVDVIYYVFVYVMWN